ncbi:MAG: hypothetical protein U0931_13980 [Vulcanimicrobiota bacterium]
MRKGFSLAEVMLSVCLLALLAAGVLGGLRGGLAQANNAALAERLADALREARQTAISSGLPVAVAFPSQNQTCFASQGYYKLAGPRARIEQTVSLAAEFPAGMIFFGATRAGDRLASDVPPAYQPWVAQVQDPALVYLPSGRLCAPRLPQLDGGCRLLICRGMSSGSSAIPAVPLAQTVAQPFVVEAGSSGAVAVHSGAPGLQAVAGALPFPALAALPALPNPGHHPPTAELTVLPRPNPQTLIPGAVADVDHDSQATLEVAAQDQDGGTLYCEWTAEAGKFSSPGREAMIWDARRLCWISRWEWRPPVESHHGDTYTLTCHITDEEGLAALDTATFRSNFKLGVTEGRLAMAGGDKQGVCVLNSDGTGVEKLWAGYTPSGFDGQGLCWYPDRSRLLVSALQAPDGAFLGFFDYSLYRVSLPGSRGECNNPRAESILAAIVTTAGLRDPSISPDGEWVAYWTSRGVPGYPNLTSGGVEMAVPEPGTTSFIRLWPPLTAASATSRIVAAWPDWSATGLIFASGSPADCPYFVGRLNPLQEGFQLHYFSPGQLQSATTGAAPSPTPLVDQAGQPVLGGQPSWSPLGTQVAYVGSDHQIYLARFQAAPPRLTVLGAVASLGNAGVGPVSWSRDGQRLLYLWKNAGAAELREVAAAPGATPRTLKAENYPAEGRLGRATWDSR